MTTNKKCLVYETLGQVSEMLVVESAPKDMMRLTGVFGVCGIKNQNNRIYDKDNYKQMVESLQKTIKETGCPGELEHPNSMNINLENVSHKIEDIQMNEDGTITGTILLLNTPKGQIAQAIIEGGLPLYISSRGAGTITNEGRVTLSTIKTYDLVGTPGFSQAKLTLKENQTLECLNESLDDGNVMYAIVEGDDLLDDDLLDDDSENKDKEKKKKTEKESSKEKPEEDNEKESSKEKSAEDNEKEPSKEKPEEDNEKEPSKEKPEEDNEKESSKEKHEEDNEKESSKEKPEEVKKETNNKNNNNVDMQDLKNAINKLTDKVNSLEAQLHIAKESLNENNNVNYSEIEGWIREEFSQELRNDILKEFEGHFSIDEKVEKLLESKMKELLTIVENWTINEFAPEVQNWIAEEYSPNIQEWITEEFAPEVQGWITEEFAPEVQGWITEEFAPVIDNWINEEFGPSHEQKINENVSSFLESNKAGRLEEIDSLLESIQENGNNDLQQIVSESVKDNNYKGVFVVENMPSEFIPSWQLLSEERKQEIVRSSRMYDFTKEGVLESFWANVDFNKEEEKINESNNDVTTQYYNNIFAQMKHFRNTRF